MDIHAKVLSIAGIWGSNIDIHLYFLKGERRALIDTGVEYTPGREVAAALKSQGLSLRDIDLVLHTHGHHDHSGGTGVVQQASGAKVYLHPADTFLVKDLPRSLQTYFVPLTEVFGESRVKPILDEVLGFYGPDFTIDGYVEEGDVIDLGRGFRLHVIGIPGHSPGSVAYYWEEEGIIFTGDALAGCRKATGQLPIIVDAFSYEKSLRRLLELPIRLLTCAHAIGSLTLPDNPVRRGDEAKKFLKECLQVNTLLQEAAYRVTRRCSPAPLDRAVAELVKELPLGIGPVSAEANLSSLWRAQSLFRYLQAAALS